MVSSFTLEQFFDACESWNLEEVHKIINSGFNIDSFDDDHVTSLQMAAATGNIGIVEFLLDQGADIEKSNQVGMTPLHHACKNGHIHVVRILIQRGANYQKLTYLGASPMTLAAAGGHLDLIKLLLDLKVSVNPTHTALCPTPIIAAAFRRHTHICALLTHRGAYLDGHIQRLANLSALSTVIICGKIPMLTALLELGANPHFRSLREQTALELAKSLKRNDVIELLTSKTLVSAKEKPSEVDLRERIIRNDEEAVKNILHNKIPYLPFPENTSPLMYAVLTADTPILKTIIEADNNNINMAESVSGLTSLMFATIIGNHEAVQILLDAGADVSLKSFDGNLSSDLLCRLQQLEIGSLPPTKIETYHNFGRMIHSSSAKILNKLAHHVPHVPLGMTVNFSRNSTKNDDDNNMWRENFKNLLRVYDNNDNNDVFITASDILRSIAPAMKSSKIDKKHNCIRLGRTLAEMYLSHGLLPSPIGFLVENSKSNPALLNYGKFDLLSSSKSSNERRFDKSNNVTRHQSSIERGSSSTLGTTPRMRKRSQGTITVNNNNGVEESGRLSPSRHSLNQYTFALKEDDKPLRKNHSKRIWNLMIESGLDNYIELFRSEEIDKTTFLSLTNDDLIDLGIRNATHRNRILKLVKDLNNGKS
ncbi:unnamed protein product [Dracunculus medinensis]|uniref:SAM domain-containing protein n=1 Tax=Dracunculus medinensis TaxID=318479 RepID=A0A0N4UAJ2_DRAME|nr:unnamed protein product [Dracunculus medinensis]